MKKIIVIIISLFSFILFTNDVYAIDTITYGDYGIKISKISFEYYLEDGAFYYDEETNLVTLYKEAEKSIDLTESITVSPEITNDTWHMSGDYPVTLIDLNIDLTELSDILLNNIPDESETYLAGMFVEYHYVQSPGTINSIYHINYAERLINSLFTAGSETEYNISKTPLGTTIKVPIAIVSYENGEYTVLDSVKDFEDNDSLAYILNYDIHSTNEDTYYINNSEEELFYIHTMSDVERIKSTIAEMYKPIISVVDYSDDYIYIQIQSADTTATSCDLYRSNRKSENYELIETLSCNEIYMDENLEENTTYYYKVIDNNGVTSDILKRKTYSYDDYDEEYESDDEYTDDDYDEEYESTNQDEEKENSGTVDNKDTGVYSYIIIEVAIIIVALIILKSNKNIMKTKL